MPSSASVPALVISPHYDDAVFSCGNLLAAQTGSVVATVCTAIPEKREILTDWDQRCGFTSAAHAMQTRSAENRLALAELGAHGVELSFLDSQYLHTPRTSFELLSDTLFSIIREYSPDSVFVPLGLFHADHLLVSDVALLLIPRLNELQWYAYADIPYNKDTDRIARRIAQLSQHGVLAEPYPAAAPSCRKTAAVSAYRSQFRGLGHADARPITQQKEQYWRLQHSMEVL